MGYKERYQEYMCSEEWALKRTQKANEQRFTCELCGVVVLKGFHNFFYKNGFVVRYVPFFFLLKFAQFKNNYYICISFKMRG